MSNTQHFNLALVPESDEFAELCLRLARANCTERADNYLLGDNALPHVTVCQFEAYETDLGSIWARVHNLHSSPIELGFRHIYVQYGKAELRGLCWVGLAVRPEPSILELQSNVFDRLLDLGVESRNTPANYFPHLTFARCNLNQPITISEPPPEDVWLSRYSFRLTIGHSDEHGRYHFAMRS